MAVTTKVFLLIVFDILLACTSFASGEGSREWSSWTGCSQTCGYGVDYRHRPCPRGDHAECDVSELGQLNRCKLQECPIHGGWSQWTNSSECSSPCGYRNQTRSCTNPIPTNGGRKCPGETSKKIRCWGLPDCEVESSSLQSSWAPDNVSKHPTTPEVVEPENSPLSSIPHPANSGNIDPVTPGEGISWVNTGGAHAVSFEHYNAGELQDGSPTPDSGNFSMLSRISTGDSADHVSSFDAGESHDGSPPTTAGDIHPTSHEGNPGTVPQGSGDSNAGDQDGSPTPDSVNFSILSRISTGVSADHVSSFDAGESHDGSPPTTAGDIDPTSQGNPETVPHGSGDSNAGDQDGSPTPDSVNFSILSRISTGVSADHVSSVDAGESHDGSPPTTAGDIDPTSQGNPETVPHGSGDSNAGDQDGSPTPDSVNFSILSRISTGDSADHVSSFDAGESHDGSRPTTAGDIDPTSQDNPDTVPQGSGDSNAGDQDGSPTPDPGNLGISLIRNGDSVSSAEDSNAGETQYGSPIVIWATFAYYGAALEVL
ncbi:papilin-like [Lytechinus pictus]|uniref:papilin-like n=1 Tax=Lytechinus pictus TaxID=7653 RepID=UPI0030BA2327